MLRAVAVVMASVFALSVAAHAVPAWGRRTGADCSSCHWGLNKLNHTGRMFLLRGHRMPDEEGIGTESYNLADYTSWASKVRFTADKDADSSTKFDVESLSIYSGGPIDKKFSYFFRVLHARASRRWRRSRQPLQAGRCLPVLQLRCRGRHLLLGARRTDLPLPDLLLRWGRASVHQPQRGD